MRNLQLLVLFSFVYLLSSCDEKCVEIPDFQPPQSDRVILMEEFTGTSCSNCPAGSATVDELLSLFPDNLIAVAIHSNFLGFPAKIGDLDMRSPDAQSVEEFLGAWRNKPEAAFNRKKFEGEENIRVRSRPDDWINFIQEELETFATVHIEAHTDYNPSTRTVEIEVNATAVEFLDGDYRLNVMILESGIKTTQLDGTEKIENYELKHAMRKLVTDVGGEAFFTKLDPGLIRSANFEFTFPDEEDMGWWIPENCEVVVFITDAATKEVLQAHQVHVIE